MKRWRLFLLISICCISPAHAQEKTVPRTKAELGFSFAPVVKKAAPAVVNIYTKGRVQVRQISPFMDDPVFRQFFGDGFQFGGIPREQVVSSLGSGVLIKPDGLIVTSYHVIKDAEAIKVVLSDKRQFEAKVTIKDPQADLAFLKIETPEALPYLELRDSDSLEVGDLVLAIGNPFGVGQTVTNGIVSGLARQAAGVSDFQFFIQTDAAINPGNSGGALVDMDGRLVGINTAIYSRSGGSNGIGFAIPANMVRSLETGKIADGGRVVRPWLGLSVQPVTAEIAESMGMKMPQGVLVNKVASGSPAEKGGLKTGDVIVSVGGTDVTSAQDLQYRMALGKIGDNASFGILRGGAPQQLSVKLEPPPAAAKSAARVLKGRNPFDGITVSDISPALAMQIGLDETASGVVVTAAAGGSTGVRVFAPGDLIIEVNNVKITSAAQLEKLVKIAATREWQITYQRGGAVTTLTVRM